MHGFSEKLLETDGLDFFRHVRIRKETFFVILGIVKENYAPVFRGGYEPIPCSSALLMTLWYLENKSTYREISLQFGCVESTVHTCVESVIDILVQNANKFIKWPNSTEAANIEKEFSNFAGFPGVIGSVDGCHIDIKAPSMVQADYLDRTHKHSVNLMAICDHSKKFLYIHAGFPGSAHDNRVLKSTGFYTKLETDPTSLFPNSNYHIIGDSAFQCNKFILVPYRDTGNLSEIQQKYNKKLSQTRYVIENAFGFLKGRFRRLKYIDASIPRIRNIIIACCILHNISLDFSEEEILLTMEDEVEVEPEININVTGVELPCDLQSAEKRDFAASFSLYTVTRLLSFAHICS